MQHLQLVAFIVLLKYMYMRSGAYEKRSFEYHMETACLNGTVISEYSTATAIECSVACSFSPNCSFVKFEDHCRLFYERKNGTCTKQADF